MNGYGSPWSVRWFFVDEPLRRKHSIDEVLDNQIISRSSSHNNMNIHGMNENKNIEEQINIII